MGPGLSFWLVADSLEDEVPFVHTGNKTFMDVSVKCFLTDSCFRWPAVVLKMPDHGVRTVLPEFDQVGDFIGQLTVPSGLVVQAPAWQNRATLGSSHWILL